MVGAWRGQWIWAEQTAVGAPAPDNPTAGSLDPARFDRRVLFRRSFELTETPAHAPFRVTADSRYVLYVNGVEVSRGPIRHGVRQLHYDTGDAAPALRVGRNTIAVLARFYGHRTAWWLPTPPSFTLGGGSLVAELRLGEDAWIVTDESWKHAPADAWTPSGPQSALSPQIPEILDARQLPHNWTRPDFDDAHWRPARAITAISMGGPTGTRPPSEPFGALRPHPLPPLAETIRTPTELTVAPLETDGDVQGADIQGALIADLAGAGAFRAMTVGELVESGLVVVDFGRIVAGQLRFTVEAEAGTLVAGALVELRTPAALRMAATFAYTARGHDDEFEAGDPAGGRYALLAVRGRARLTAVTVRERHRRRPDGPFFDCADPELTEIHRVGLRSVDLTAQDAYLDCPTREQRAWTGDAVVHQSVDLVSNPDWSLARWHPRLAAWPRPDGLLPMVAAGDCADQGVASIPDWSLHWIRSVHNLYRYTGDRALVGELLRSAESVLAWFEPFLGVDGLLHDVTGWVLIDWSPVAVAGCSAALNALWGRALLDFAEMAEWLGDRYRAEWARALHGELRAGFERFWDERRGAYRDTLAEGTSVSEHSMAAAVCAGLVPEERAGVARAFLLDRAALFTRSPVAAHGSDAEGAPEGVARFGLPAPDWDTDTLVVGAQPFFRYVVHDALALLGAADAVAELCRDWSALLARGRTAWRETWEGGSFCHGWSATPTRDLVVHTLGVTPAEPGYARVRVAPRLGGLAWAKGAVPTPHGLVTVSVAGDRVSVDSPVPVEIVALDGTVRTCPPGLVEAALVD